jgi:hypothetical protein
MTNSAILLRVRAKQSISSSLNNFRVRVPQGKTCISISNTATATSRPSAASRLGSLRNTTKQKLSHWRGATPVIIGCLVGGGCTWKLLQQQPSKSNCEAAVLSAAVTPPPPSLTGLVAFDKVEEPLLKKVRRCLRLIRRLFKLFFFLSPVVAFYPLTYLQRSSSRGEQDSTDSHDVVLSSLANNDAPKGILGLYFRMCLYCVECSGAAAIKMMQWAGSRPDMFGEDFSAVFSRLQDDTTPHGWKHTENALREAYGDDWQDHIRLHEILGSGCIAQVYKGVVSDEDGKEEEVAVKGETPYNHTICTCVCVCVCVVFIDVRRL